MQTQLAEVLVALTVFVHDYAGIGRLALQKAQNEAARILRTAGVEVTWAYCADSEEAPPECRNLPGRTELVLHLLPAGATRRDAHPGSLGFAAQPESGEFGSYAGVLYDRVERLSSAAGKSVVLGHAIAHELGHLLLGEGGHAPHGIMKAEWHRTELQKAAQGTLLFREEERRRIQDNLRRRLTTPKTMPLSCRRVVGGVEYCSNLHNICACDDTLNEQRQGSK